MLPTSVTKATFFAPSVLGTVASSLAGSVTGSVAGSVVGSVVTSVVGSVAGSVGSGRAILTASKQTGDHRHCQQQGKDLLHVSNLQNMYDIGFLRHALQGVPYLII